MSDFVKTRFCSFCCSLACRFFLDMNVYGYVSSNKTWQEKEGSVHNLIHYDQLFSWKIRANYRSEIPGAKKRGFLAICTARRAVALCPNCLIGVLITFWVIPLSIRIEPKAGIEKMSDIMNHVADKKYECRENMSPQSWNGSKRMLQSYKSQTKTTRI